VTTLTDPGPATEDARATVRVAPAPDSYRGSAYSAATWLLRRAAKFCVDTDQCPDEPINHVAWLIRASMHWLATGREG